MSWLKQISFGEERFIISEKSSFFLDVLRAISAELVVIAHFTDYHEDHYLRLIFKDAGVFAVGVFFILSGLLIANSVWNKKATKTKYQFKNYFVDRFFRIFAALVPALVFGVVIDIIAHQAYSLPLINSSLGVFAGNLLMLQEYPVFTELSYYLPVQIGEKLRMPFMGSNLPLWTLSIEWWIYMFFGWILLREKRNWFYYVVLVFFAVVPVYQLFIGTRMGPGLTGFWLIGLAIAILVRSKNQTLKKVATSSFVTLISLIMMIASYSFGNWRIAIVCLGLVMFQVFFVNRKGDLFSKRLNRIVRISANYSFTLYLTHFPILRLMSEANLNCSVELQLLINILICNAVALILAFIFENRHKGFKSYWMNHIQRN